MHLNSKTYLPASADYPFFIAVQDDLVEEVMETKGLAAALLVLVHLSPASGEPVAFHVNNRLTQMKSVNATSSIPLLNSKETVEINFVQSLLDDSQENPIGTAGSNPMHFFIAAVDGGEEIETEKANLIGAKKDDLLQTWMELNYRENGEDPDVFAQLQLYITNQKIRDVTVDDINHLHFVLNIQHFYPETTATLGRSEIPVVFFRHIFDKLRQMPLHNALLLFNFITGDYGLGIPLFQLNETGTPPPIHQQWTMLSYFLQFCSPICLSPMEGGHRTMQLIKYFTGAPFTNQSPQPFEPQKRRPQDLEIKPNYQIAEFGVAMTCYDFIFWQRFSKSEPLNGAVAKKLQKHSFAVKAKQSIVCVDTFNGLFVEVLNAIKLEFNAKSLQDFRVVDMFNNHRKGQKTFDERVKIAYPVILNAIKTNSKTRERWAQIKEPWKLDYDNPVGKELAHLMPVFDNMKSCLVSHFC